MKKTLKDMTPQKYACPLGDCPAVFKSNAETYVIIGKICDATTPELQGRIGRDEMAVEIPAGLLETVLQTESKEG